MVEIYLNYLCEKICDYGFRADLFLDDGNHLEIDKKLKELPNNDLSLHINLAENLGYKNQTETIIKSLISSLKKTNRADFKIDFNKGMLFYELEKSTSYQLKTS